MFFRAAPQAPRVGRTQPAPRWARAARSFQCWWSSQQSALQLAAPRQRGGRGRRPRPRRAPAALPRAASEAPLAAIATRRPPSWPPLRAAEVSCAPSPPKSLYCPGAYALAGALFGLSQPPRRADTPSPPARAQLNRAELPLDVWRHLPGPERRLVAAAGCLSVRCELRKVVC